MPSPLVHKSDTINIGVCDMFFTPNATGIPIHLGLTKGGAKLSYEAEYHELTADQTGTTPLDDVLIGEKVSIEASVLNTTKSHIGHIVPTATAAGSGDNPSAVTFGSLPGKRATHYAGKLVAHPISMDLDESYDIIIYRTANTGNMELAFQLDSEWVIPCVFKAYSDDFRQPGDQLFRIGADDYDGSVYKRVVKFWITPANPSIMAGNTVAFHANAMYEDGTTEDVTSGCTWISSDTGVVSLTGQGTGTVTAAGVSAGSAVVRAEFTGYSNTTSMVVS